MPKSKHKMKKADARKVGIGLTNRQVLEVLQSMSEKDLDRGFIVRGREHGYDFLSYFGPNETQLRIGTSRKDSKLLCGVGKPIALLQDANVAL